METTHTPGPWYAEEASMGQGLVCSEVDGRNIAVTYDVKDAWIIAKAPAMLDSLRDCVEFLNTEDWNPEAPPEFLVIARNLLYEIDNE